jgi:ribosomal protein S12 methylthiotransferase
MSAQTTLSVAFISLGCAKNTVDSQVMAGRLVQDGLTLSPSPEEADAVVINTCSFIKSARDESLQVIREACKLKEHAEKVIIVTGCLPQKEQGALAQALPEVDAFMGLDQLNRISQVIRSAANRKSLLTMLSPVSTKLFEPALPGLAFSAGAYAYVKISEGCNHPCAFCTIPAIRGRFRSRHPSSIVREAEKLLETGFREITLVSQDSTAYGRDLAKPSSLAKLLAQLDRIGGKFWIRFLYGFPGLVTTELLETMAGSERICNYLDVPVQHSHPEILKLMRRASTASYVARLPETARKFLPDASLRTTLISGFPGEKKAHFDHLMQYLTDARFDHVGVFPYSPEEGTPAAALKPVPRKTVESRIDRLVDLQSRLFDAKGSAMKGAVQKVLLERQTSDKTWLGRTAAQAPEVDSTTIVRVKSSKLKPGDFVEAKITSHKGYTLRATQV